jgi:hypothetical protein
MKLLRFGKLPIQQGPMNIEYWLLCIENLPKSSIINAQHSIFNWISFLNQHICNKKTDQIIKI